MNLSVPSPLSWLWVHYWSRRLKPGNDIKIEVVDQAGAIFDNLWVRLKGNWPLSIIRDSTWINWRYLSVPERLYKVLMARRDGLLVGYIIYWLQSFSGGSAGMVAEFLYEDRGVRDALLGALVEQLGEAEVESLIGLAVPGTAESAEFRSIGAVFGWGAFDVRILPLDNSLDASFLNESKNWLMFGGDFDVI